MLLPLKEKSFNEQKFSNLWVKDEKYSGWVKKSSKGVYFFYCNSCKSDLKCGGGKRVLDKHAESTKHKFNVKLKVDVCGLVCDFCLCYTIYFLF